MERALTADRWSDPPPWTGAALASFRARARAGAIDGLIAFVPVGVAVVVFGLGLESLGWTLFVLASGWTLLYPVLTLSRSGRANGQTIGKERAGIRVVRDDGRRVTPGLAALREALLKNVLFGWLGQLFLLIPLLIDLLWPLWDEQRRTLHDTIVGTHVVETG